jgi:hypothetical protein
MPTSLSSPKVTPTLGTLNEKNQLRFVDPVFKQVGGGQIYALIAKCIGYLEEIP